MSASQYWIVYKPSAAKALRKLDRQYQRVIVDAIEALALNPRPEGGKELQGGDGECRIRAGSYRVVYDIDEAP